jgi:hypothetical protein
MRAISLIISLIVLVALYECKVVEKGKLMVKSLKTEETWNKSFEKARLGKTKSEGEKKAKNEGHEKLRARILNRLNDISGPLSWTKTKGTLNNSKTEYSWIKSLKKFLLGEQLLDNDLTMNKEDLKKLLKIINRYNRVGYLRVPETIAVRMKLKKKSIPEDISLVEETHKENGQVEERSFSKFIMKKLCSYLKKVVNDFYNKIKYIEMIESNRNDSPHIVSHKYRTTYFIG